jgi:thymidylate synthase
VTGLDAGEFVHVLGDAHVYKNHVVPLKEQLLRTPKEFPKLFIKSEKKNIGDLEFKDFDLKGYDPHPAIAMEMSV